MNRLCLSPAVSNIISLRLFLFCGLGLRGLELWDNYSCQTSICSLRLGRFVRAVVGVCFRRSQAATSSLR